MHIQGFSFGCITIDGVAYEHDVLIDRGHVKKRSKKPSKKFGDRFGHTPLSAAEKIPWRCRRLVIGTGAYGNLLVMDDVKREAARRDIQLIVVSTFEAIEVLRKAAVRTNAVLHVTC